MIPLTVDEVRGIVFAIRFYEAVRRACGRPIDEAAVAVLAKLTFALRVEQGAHESITREAEALGLRAASRREFVLRLLDHPHPFEAP